MQYVPPLNPRLHPNLDQLLANRGRTLDWLNSSEDPDSEPSIARRNLVHAAEVIPFHYRSALPAEPALRTWADAVADQARQHQVARGALMGHAHRGPSLLLLGPTGVGKTHSAYGAIRDLAITGVTAHWVVTTAADMYGALRPRHGVDSESEFRRYRDARLLLIDDLGADRKPTEFTEEVNFRLVNHRYEQHLPTLMTSNVGATDLAARLGDRVTSRLAEMCQRVVLKGHDRRRGQAGEAA
ncbi:ATP-binding protein [Streptomyces sp. NBC_00433]